MSDEGKLQGILSEEGRQRLRESMAVFGADFERRARASIEAAGREASKFIAGFRRDH